MKSETATLIHADLIIDDDGCHEGDRYLVVEGGRIAAIRDEMPPAFIGPTLRYDKCMILPLLCDHHLHFSAAMLLSAQDVGEELAAWGIGEVWDGGDAASAGIDFKAAVGNRLSVHAAGAGLSKRGGYGRNIGICIDGPREAHQHIDWLVDRGVEYIKIVNSGIVLPDEGVISAGGFTREELGGIIRYANEKGLPAVCHANGDCAVRDAIEAGCATIIHGYGSSAETLAMMAEKKVSFIPTLHAFEHIETVASAKHGDMAGISVAARHAETVRSAFDLGVRMLAGSDAAPGFLAYGSSLWNEFRSLVTAGIPFESVILPSAPGQLRTGMAADFIVAKAMAPVAVYRDGIRVLFTGEKNK